MRNKTKRIESQFAFNFLFELEFDSQEGLTQLLLLLLLFKFQLQLQRLCGHPWPGLDSTRLDLTWHEIHARRLVVTRA